MVPVVRLAVLCSRVEFDRDGVVFSLVEPTHTVRMPAGERYYRPPPLVVYAQVGDGVGTCFVTAQLREPGGTVLYRTPPTELTFDGTVILAEPSEIVFELDGLEFPGPGRYDLHILCNHQSFSELSTAGIPFPPLRVDVIPVERSMEGES